MYLKVCCCIVAKHQNLQQQKRMLLAEGEVLDDYMSEALRKEQCQLLLQYCRSCCRFASASLLTACCLQCHGSYVATLWLTMKVKALGYFCTACVQSHPDTVLRSVERHQNNSQAMSEACLKHVCL